MTLDRSQLPVCECTKHTAELIFQSISINCYFTPKLFPFTELHHAVSLVCLNMLHLLICLDKVKNERVKHPASIITYCLTIHAMNDKYELFN